MSKVQDGMSQTPPAIYQFNDESLLKFASAIAEAVAVRYVRKDDLKEALTQIKDEDPAFLVDLLRDAGACVDHTEEIDLPVAATSTSTGLTEGSHCSACGKVLKAQEITPTLSADTTVTPGGTQEPVTAKKPV